MGGGGCCTTICGGPATAAVCVARKLASVKGQLTRARNDGYLVHFIDETMVTRTTVPKAEWTKPKENMTVDQAHLNEPTLALLAGISK